MTDTEISFNTDELIVHNIKFRIIVFGCGDLADNIAYFCIFPQEFNFVSGKATKCFITEVNGILLKSLGPKPAEFNPEKIIDIIFKNGPIVTLKVKNAEQQIINKDFYKQKNGKYGVQIYTHTQDCSYGCTYMRCFDQNESNRIISINGIYISNTDHDQIIRLISNSDYMHVSIENIKAVKQEQETTSIKEQDVKCPKYEDLYS